MYGNRTRLLGLGSRCTTDVLTPHESKSGAKVQKFLHISKKSSNFAAEFEECGVSTSVVHRLPKPRRRVRFPYTAQESKSVYRWGGKERGTLLDLIRRGKSGQHRAPQRLTAVRQQCLVPATETSDVKRAHCGLQFQVNRRLSVARVSRRVGSEREAW